MTPRRVLVVGGGIIGLAGAFQLARDGHEITIFDPSLGRGATWAAAGMIAPSAEIAPGEESNYQLQRQALGAWKELSAQLLDVTGQGVQIHESGTLLTAWDAGDRRLIEQFAHVAVEFGAAMDRVSRSDSPELFEGLSARMSDGLVMRDDAWLDPDEAVARLVAGLAALGARVVSERVVKIGANGDGVFVETEHENYRADAGILATGSTSLPDGAAPGGHNVVRPVRGITVRVQGFDRSEQPMVRAFVKGRAFYMVSRPGGYCVLGATSDERSELAIEVGELQRLLRDALDVVPALETTAVSDIRYGLRPASADLRPFFEQIAPEGWSWVSGHYRHGVTLAPLAARDVLTHVGSAR